MGCTHLSWWGARASELLDGSLLAGSAGTTVQGGFSWSVRHIAVQGCQANRAGLKGTEVGRSCGSTHGSALEKGASQLFM